MPVPLPLAIPLGTASLAYLSAKYALPNDLKLLSSYISAIVKIGLAARNDKLNFFYRLETLALSKTHANHPFIKYNGRTWTYREGYDMVLKYGTWLKETHNVAKGEVVAIDCVNSQLFVWIWFGLWSIGAKAAFINYNLTGKPLLHSVKTSTARLMLVDPDVSDAVNAEALQEFGSLEFRDGKGAVECVFLTPELEAEIEAVPAKRLPDEERAGETLSGMGNLIYTSGTTGLPKPAVVSWQKIWLSTVFVTGWLPLKQSDTLYTCMPLYHSSAAILALLTTLQAGSTIAIGRKFSRTTFWSDVRSSGATGIQYVGETCRYLLSAPPSPDDKNHNVRFAFGNGMRPDVWDKFKSRFGIQTIAEFYSATESPSGLWNHSSNGYAAGAVGRNGKLAEAVLGSTMRVFKMDFENNLLYRDPKTGLAAEAPRNEAGELLFKLDEKDIQSKFQGYYGNNKATNSKVVMDVLKKGDAWFSTGDVMRWDNEGRWYFVDRIGDTYRWKSENVSTAEVAECLGAVEGVEEVNVYGVTVPKHDGRAGCAAVVLDGLSGYQGKSRAQEVERRLRKMAERARKELPRYAVPLFVRVARKLETTGTNKHQKHHLREEGIVPEKIQGAGDEIWWLKDGTYVQFGGADYGRLEDGAVKL
ncbi:fatty acid transporter protein [Aulographum hederae CBS 113979]|uniref:Very long-chain fatty acid transport protein n=1 Tax=Aulographum hederae CBS 113979 TaxID=1176131 RepID=A0A6G1HBK3_9PEZI|nr:fatty acid transporter protein [Aulographum hederae CBS 113979]